jgi:hypothetical protein
MECPTAAVAAAAVLVVGVSGGGLDGGNDAIPFHPRPVPFFDVRPPAGERRSSPARRPRPRQRQCHQPSRPLPSAPSAAE